MAYQNLTAAKPGREALATPGSLTVAAATALTAATLTHGASNAALTLTADTAGSAGNLISLTIVQPGSGTNALAVGLTGNDITVTLPTTADAPVAATATAVAAALNGNTAIAAKITATAGGDGTGTVATKTKTQLASGADFVEAKVAVTSSGFNHLALRVTNATGGSKTITVVEGDGDKANGRPTVLVIPDASTRVIGHLRTAKCAQADGTILLDCTAGVGLALEAWQA